MPHKVVIIGHSFTSRLGIIRSVAQIGCEVTVVVMTSRKRFRKTLKDSIQIDCHSKYVSQVFYCYGTDGEGLIQLLLNQCSDAHQKVILIPDSDFSAATIDQHQNRLKDNFLFPHIRHQAGAVEEWMNKERQKTLALQLGMNVAQSVVVDIVKGQYVIPKDVRYPCFTKPVLTICGGKKFFKKCNNESELFQLLERAGRFSGISILVEDYKQIDTEYAVLGFTDGEKTVIPAVIKFLQPSQSHPGIALRGEIIPIDGFESIISQFKAYVQQIGFFGLFDIDFYLSEGKLFFGELNLRFGGSGYAVTKMGVNLPGMMVRSLRGDRIDEMGHEIRTSAVFVNERMCFDDWYHGFISEKELHQLIKSADIRFIDDEQDPNPQIAFEAMIRKKRIRRPFVKLYIHIKSIYRNMI